MSINVHLERFEGPLGLLLHLIREQEMDIFNINIHEITRQYLEYIKIMRRLDLEVAGEFVAMAATLLHIKSRMLLPQYNEEGEVVEVDPRKELVDRLLEYKKFKELSGDLYKRPLLGRDVLPRGEGPAIEATEEGELILEDNPLFSLIAAYRLAMKNMKKTVHRVIGELQSIAERIMEIRGHFVVGKRILFSELIVATEQRSNQVLVTFLSLLELAKMGFISVFQTEAFADIHIEARKAIDAAAVTHVESYDAVNAEEKAAEILNKAQLQLSLDEVEPETADEDTSVVAAAATETVPDLGASDDDILAEELRIAEEDLAAGHIPSPDAVTDHVFAAHVAEHPGMEGVENLHAEHSAEALEVLSEPLAEEVLSEVAAAPDPAQEIIQPSEAELIWEAAKAEMETPSTGPEERHQPEPSLLAALAAKQMAAFDDDIPAPGLPVSTDEVPVTPEVHASPTEGEALAESETPNNEDPDNSGPRDPEVQA